ncbi:enoyl-CoA delta isomerase 1, mitochondrial-like [Epargyreus clarus]|uniref:enoyl-CoA delta isomerase 1, mitochondrial-like n=1 Tax=Epargyreus clarus TaxID=520877 RepID=UPI003C2CA865
MYLLRPAAYNVRRIVPSLRTMAGQAGPLTDLKVDNDGVAILTMQRMPVNSLNLDLLQDLSKSFDEVAKNKARAMILTSASRTVFSAGLDIMEMYKPDLKRAEAFWSTLQEVWLKLFGANFITAAAINGHSPAGGCLLSMSCEYRAMVAGKYSIGLNETALGIIAPPWFMDTMCHTIPMRQAELALTTGKLFPVDEALKVGLIDEIATDKDDAIAKCKAFIKKFDRIPPLARSITKLSIREGPLKRLQANRKEDVAEFIKYVGNPKIQQGLEMYIQAMKQKAKK